MLGSETPGGGSLEYLSPTRQALVMAIKVLGEASTEELARETYLSPGAVRQHLLSLEAQGLVAFTRVRVGPGRPRHVFRLTPQGEALFPNQYASIAASLLAALRGEPPPTFERVIGSFTESQAASARQLLPETGPDPLSGIYQLLERFGYYPRLELSPGEAPAIRLRHCPLLQLATEVPELCDAECRVLQALVPEYTVTRTEHRLAGDPLCTYQFDPNP